MSAYTLRSCRLHLSNLPQHPQRHINNIMHHPKLHVAAGRQIGAHLRQFPLIVPRLLLYTGVHEIPQLWRDGHHIIKRCLASIESVPEVARRNVGLVVLRQGLEAPTCTDELAFLPLGLLSFDWGKSLVETSSRVWRGLQNGWTDRRQGGCSPTSRYWHRWYW